MAPLSYNPMILDFPIQHLLLFKVVCKVPLQYVFVRLRWRNQWRLKDTVTQFYSAQEKYQAKCEWVVEAYERRKIWDVLEFSGDGNSGSERSSLDLKFRSSVVRSETDKLSLWATGSIRKFSMIRMRRTFNPVAIQKNHLDLQVQLRPECSAFLQARS